MSYVTVRRNKEKNMFETLISAICLPIYQQKFIKIPDQLFNCIKMFGRKKRRQDVLRLQYKIHSIFSPFFGLQSFHIAIFIIKVFKTCRIFFLSKCTLAHTMICVARTIRSNTNSISFAYRKHASKE